jgi:hypothetical protein
MAGLAPAIHVFVAKESKTWITGTSPVMTGIELRRSNPENAVGDDERHALTENSFLTASMSATLGNPASLPRRWIL